MTIKELLDARRTEQQAQLAFEEARVEVVHRLVDQLVDEAAEAGERVQFMVRTDHKGAHVLANDYAVLFAPFKGGWSEKDAVGAPVWLLDKDLSEETIDAVKEAVVEVILKKAK